MSVALDHVARPDPGAVALPLDDLQASHGVSGSGARMYKRFFGQEGVLVYPAPHSEMLRDTLRALVAARPELKWTPGIACYAKTQTHTTPPDADWLARLFREEGLGDWEVATLSMTNCATALAAIHCFAARGEPLLVLAGEKTFHPTGSRLSVGLLGEMPVAALFRLGPGRAIAFTRVRHMPRFHLNPDDMATEDRRALQSAFETGFTDFLTDCIAAHPAFFDRAPVLVPYNLNVPLIERVLDRLGLSHLIAAGHSGRLGHGFCSDPFQNLALLDIPPARPVFAFCAGMGVTFAGLALGPADHDVPPPNPTP